VARSVALMMIEGTRDAYFRQTRPEASPEGPPAMDFGRPQEFVGQKRRVFKQLKSPAGWAKAVASLLRPALWRRMLGRVR
jgi:hypothetical protein